MVPSSARSRQLLSSRSDDTGIFVSDIIRGSVTDLDGRLLLGDQILSINGEDVRAAAQEHAQTLLQVRQIPSSTWLRLMESFSLLVYHFPLKSCSGVIHLEVARFKAGLQRSQQKQVHQQKQLRPEKTTTRSFKPHVHESGTKFYLQ